MYLGILGEMSRLVPSDLVISMVTLIVVIMLGKFTISGLIRSSSNSDGSISTLNLALSIGIGFAVALVLAASYLAMWYGLGGWGLRNSFYLWLSGVLK